MKRKARPAAPPRLPPEPEGPVPLDFEIRPSDRASSREWLMRAAWLAHVRAHGQALADLAVKGAPGDAGVKLVADRFRDLLRLARSSRFAERPLDLLTTPPVLERWPPVFSGEPLSPEMEAAITEPLAWDSTNKIAVWCRTFAHIVPGLSNRFAVDKIARQHLAALLSSALSGLERVNEARRGDPVTSHMATMAKPRKASQKLRRAPRRGDL